MIVYQYDKSFDGLLTCIFEAYDRKMFPDILQAEGVPLPLFHEEVIRIITDERKSSRVWKGLEKRLSPAGLSVITSCWLSELPDTDRLLFRYIRKAIDALRPIEINFGDPDVLEATQIAKKVGNERLRVVQFHPFSKNHRRNLFCRPRTDIQCTAFGYRSLSKPIRRPMLVAV